MKIGTWNVTSLTGKEVELIDEMKKYKIEILGLSETKRKGIGELQLDDGYVLMYSGVSKDKRAKEGVGIVISESLKHHVTNWEGISSRIIRLDLQTKENRKITLIQVYGPTEDKDIVDKETFYHDLQLTVDKIRNTHENIFILGDWNSRIGNDSRKGHGCMGKHGGERNINDNGVRMIEFCIDNNLLIGNTWYPHKQLHKTTFVSETRGASSTIDFITYEKNARKMVKDVRVYRSAELSTEHKLLIAKMNFSIERREKCKTFEKINWNKLKDMEIREKYKKKLDEVLRTQEMSQVNKWTTFKNTILKTAEEICGKKKISPRNKRTKWWNESVKDKIKRKKDAWKEYTRTKRPEDQEKYRKARGEAKLAVKYAKQQTWIEFGTNLEEKFETNKKEFWTMVKGLRGKTSKGIRNIKDKNNNIKSKTQDILETWKVYYEEYFNISVPDTGKEDNRPNQEEDEGQDEEIKMIEVETAIKRMKTGKAAGYDEIPPELIKYGGDQMKQWIHNIFQEAWQTENIPEDWKNNIIIPIHKKGETTKCENYRAICLSSIVFKLYTSILEKRLRKQIENKFSEEQSGFRPSKQTQDHIFTIRTIAEKAINRQRNLYLAFLDLKAAFDTVSKIEVYSTLNKLKVNTKLQKVIKSVCNEVRGVVRLKGKKSKTFEMKNGLKQGDSLSPLLFIAIMDQVLKQCKSKTKKHTVGNWKMQPIYTQALLYADDVVLIADTKEELQNVVTVWADEIKNKGMTLNVSKSKWMKITKGGESEDLDISWEGKQVEQVTEYTYLGVKICNNGKIEQEINNRISKANNIYYQLNNTILGKKEINTKTKLQVYNSIYVPTLTYGSESWIINKRIESRITASEMKCLRKIQGVTKRDKLRNQNIRNQLQTKPVVENIIEKSLKWIGHVIRMKDERIPKSNGSETDWV